MSRQDFIRDYELSVRVGEVDVIIKPPMRVEFSAVKSISGQLNKILLAVYNLEPSKRLELYKDVEDVKVMPLLLFVGYQGRMELIFRGTIGWCASDCEGADIVTRIRCFDGGSDFVSSFICKTVTANDVAIDSVLEALPLVGKGKISERQQTIRPRVLVGSPSRVLDSLVETTERWYVDNERLYILKDNEVVGEYIPLVSAATGLISAPTRAVKRVTFKTLINPSVSIGKRARVESVLAPHLNGVYKVEDITYSGDNYGSTWFQECTGRLIEGAKVL